MNTITKFYEKYKKTIYEILFCFIACGIIGWFFETIVVVITMSEITDRGILFVTRIYDFPIIWGLPFIMIYGVGGVIILWGFKPFAKNIVLLFFACMAVMTVFEYTAAVFCEYVLGQVLWDYSDRLLNFQGRVCLRSSVAWGVLGVLGVKFLGPFFHKIYGKIKNEYIMHIILIALTIYVLICYLIRPVLYPDMM
ncbi:MAG: putative ABC transporter permease [Oscillospiraceae bacterium]|jgi:uncharacterized membrane protein|nr:putative ABC transporter permease [Oscillospiraceae bacterium]